MLNCEIIIIFKQIDIPAHLILNQPANKHTHKLLAARSVHSPRTAIIIFIDSLIDFKILFLVGFLYQNIPCNIYK